MFRHVLVPLDGSPEAERAIECAVELTLKDAPLLHFVCVAQVPHLDPSHPGPREASLRRYSATRVAKIMDTLHSTRGVRVTNTLLGGTRSVAAALARYVEAASIDLVVMTSHGRTGWKRAWSGSVADELARSITAPLMLIRTGVDISRRDHLDRVLVLLDGSAEAEAAIGPAAAIAHQRHSAVILGRVVSAVPYQLDGATATGIVATDSEATRLVIEEAKLYLGRLSMRLRDNGLVTETAVRVAPPLSGVGASAALLATELDAGMVALITHDRGGSRLLLGSIADRLLRKTPCALLLCHAVRTRSPAAVVARESATLAAT